MVKHHLVVRQQGKCSCGMRKRSEKVLFEHARSKGHTVEVKPRITRMSAG